MKPEEAIDFQIRWAWHRIMRMYNNEASKYGSTMSVGYTLLNIDSENGTPSTKLGPQMGMEPRSLTRMLKTMEGNGLIFRKADKEDKRMVRIFLTPFGKEKREVSKEVVKKFNSTIYEKVPQKKLNVFFEVINKINEIVEKEDIFKNGKKNNRPEKID
jgi:MarR family transcriptional regulator, organic hydroperoxide resistance regulator